MRDRLRELHEDHGMTLVEVMVALTILITGVVGSFGAIDALRRLGGLNEKKQEASRLAEQEIEHLRSMGWSSLQLSSTPAAMNDSRGTVANGNYTPPVSGGPESLIIAGSCATSTSCVDPGPTAWSAGNASGSIYRFVTNDDDTTCGSPCTPATDRKRVTVAVTVSAPNNPLRAIVMSTLVIDPTATPNGTTAPTNPVASTAGNSIGAATGTTYYFTDTPAGATYAAPSSSHTTHDTITGTGVPDQLQLAIPSAPADGSQTPRTYSTDVDPGSAGGLGITGSATCSGATATTAHEWVTPVINASAAKTATGNAGLTLPTASWDHVVTPATLCVRVYDVVLNASTNKYTSNTLLGSYTFAQPIWPADPDTIAFPFRYLASGATASLAAGHRLGVRLTVDSSMSAGLTAIYDHPTFPGSVQLETQ
jgi:type II secretory pathway pseudopilin PulG